MGRGKGKAEGPAFKCLFLLILPLWGSSPCPMPSLHLSQFCVTAPSMLSYHCPFSLPLTLNVGTGCDVMAGPRRAASAEGPEQTERRAGGRVSAVPNLCVTAGCILSHSSHITTRGPSPQGPGPSSWVAQSPDGGRNRGPRVQRAWLCVLQCGPDGVASSAFSNGK